MARDYGLRRRPALAHLYAKRCPQHGSLAGLDTKRTGHNNRSHVPPLAGPDHWTVAGPRPGRAGRPRPARTGLRMKEREVTIKRGVSCGRRPRGWGRGAAGGLGASAGLKILKAVEQEAAQGE